jgi:hypothetical protein
MNENAYLDQVASLAGLRHYPRQGPWGRKSGSVIGAQDNSVTVIGFNRSQKQSWVVIILRFKKMDHAEMLKTAIVQSEAVLLKKYGKLAAVGSDFVRWEWKYSFKKPKAEDVVQLANSLRTVISPVITGFEGRCEKCNRTSVSELTLMNGIPTYICSSCQDMVRQEQNRAAADYDSLQADYPNGFALGIGAAVVGGIVWGAVAYALNHIFLYGAILIGYFISKAILKGTGKITRVTQISIPILTIGSVLLGDAIFFSLYIMKAQHLSFSFTLLGSVITNLWSIEIEGSGPATFIFALIGAGYALYVARKPKFKAVFEPLSRSEA